MTQFAKKRPFPLGHICRYGILLLVFLCSSACTESKQEKRENVDQKQEPVIYLAFDNNLNVDGLAKKGLNMIHGTKAKFGRGKAGFSLLADGSDAGWVGWEYQKDLVFKKGMQIHFFAFQQFPKTNWRKKQVLFSMTGYNSAARKWCRVALEVLQDKTLSVFIDNPIQPAGFSDIKTKEPLGPGWNEIELKYDRGSELLSVFLNSRKVAESRVDNPVFNIGLRKFSVGAWAAHNRPFYGNIDEFKIFDA